MYAGARTEDPIPVNDQFLISATVIDAAREWRVGIDGEHIRCVNNVVCGQSIIHVAGRLVSLAEIETALLAHLMQRHGWTREEVGHG